LQRFYFIAAILGAVAPYAVYFGYLHYVPGASGLLSLAWGSPIAAATLMDFTIACLVFWPFLFSEAKRLGLKHVWLFIPANCIIGLSFALPAFLYVRQKKLDASVK
jgi:Terpene cyclase DEP1